MRLEDQQWGRSAARLEALGLRLEGCQLPRAVPVLVVRKLAIA